MKVLSLFDGISSGMVALERAFIPVERYVAYEIDESAIKISNHNYPMIKHNGDVIQANYKEGEFDLLIGGSPCSYWSIAQNSSAREVVNSGVGWDLFLQYVRALKEVKPTYFLYENNKSMSPVIRAEITKNLGVVPICINSALVSAQSRKRLYWTNIPNVTIPEDRGIKLADIIESGSVDRDKALCLTSSYDGFMGTQALLCRRYFGRSFGQVIFEGDIADIKAKWKANPYFESSERNARPLSVKECERLQTLPDDYTNVVGVSKAKRIKCIGNGWTIDVIAHILSFIKK